MKLLTFFFYLLIQYAAFAASPGHIPVRLKNCITALRSEKTEIAIRHLSQGFESLNLNNNEDAKLLALENLLSNDHFRASLQNQRSEAHLKLRLFINKGASQNFYKRCISLIEKYSPPHALSFILIAKQNLIPAYMPSPENLPPGALQHAPKATKILSDALRFLFDDNPKIKPAHFTRRLFAYIGRYPTLTQVEKYNLTVNFILELRKKQSEYNQALDKAFIYGKSPERVALYSFHRYPEASSDGTLFICGTLKCNYFFAVMEDARFFIVHRDNGALQFEVEKWNTHKRLREAKETEEEE